MLAFMMSAFFRTLQNTRRVFTDHFAKLSIQHRAQAIKKLIKWTPPIAAKLCAKCLDVVEGADMLMVKPAGVYLDVIASVRAATDLPIAAYQVSGEYAMIMAAAQNGWLDGDAAMLESLLAIKRAGADVILSYFALRAAARLNA
jgi:hypothetical protein